MPRALPSPPLRTIAATSAALGLLLCTTYGQEPPPSNPNSSDVVRMSEFNVTTEAESGYIAAESVTGSRVAVKIRDLPYNVNVVTSEFLNDFAYFEVEDNLSYTSSLNGLDQGGGYNMRGYGATTMLRNGFFRLGLVDRVNVDRIEVIKGPSAAIYGQTTPGGLLNIITKKPKAKPEQSLSVSYGSYDTIRTELNSTGPLAFGRSGDSKTNYLLSGAFYERSYDAEYVHQRSKTLSFGVEHAFDETSKLYVEFEWLNRSTNPVSAAPFIFDPVTGRYTGLAEDLADFSQNGPVSENNREIFSTFVTYEKRINSVFSARAAANYYHRHLWNFNNGSASQYDPATRQILNRNVAKGIINEDGGGFQADLVANYPLFDGALENKTLLTFDYSTYWRYDPTRQLAASARDNPALFTRNLLLDAPDYRVPLFSSGLYSNLTRENKNRTDVIGTFLRHQTTAMDGRLIAIAGLRYDYVKFNLRDLRANVQSKYNVDAVTPSVGLNYKLTPAIALYANRSESFTPQSQTANATQRLPNETAVGYDYGVKVALLDERLQFTLGGFSIEREGVRIEEVDASGTVIARAAGTQKSDGVEFDFTWRVTDAFTLLGGYGYVDSRTTEAGRDLDMIGRPPPRVPRHNAGIAAKYAITSGTLKGLSFTGGFSYIGESHSETAGALDLDGDGFFEANDGRRGIKTPAYYTLDLGAAYRFRPEGSSVSHNVGLNVKNALDRDYVNGRRQQTDNIGVYVNYGLTF